jgi:chemotaxis protein methyltransferase CheR
MNQEINDEEIVALTRAILLRYGIDFTNYEQISFRRRVARIMKKFHAASSYDLWKYFLREPNFINTFIDELTVGLTELFRNPDLWQEINTTYLSKLREQPVIKIWHAGCSTGEEIYTMAIVLHEAGLLHKTKIIASDLSQQAVQAAKAGLYSSELVAAYKKNYMNFNPFGNFDNYFTKDAAGNIQAKSFLTENITFLQHNLTKDTMNEQFDIIFCRNVMIYFDEVLKKKVLQLFWENLKKEGHLVIGYYDALPPDNQHYFEMESPSYKIFKPIISQPTFA